MSGAKTGRLRREELSEGVAGPRSRKASHRAHRTVCAKTHAPWCTRLAPRNPCRPRALECRFVRDVPRSGKSRIPATHSPNGCFLHPACRDLRRDASWLTPCCAAAAAAAAACARGRQPGRAPRARAVQNSAHKDETGAALGSHPDPAWPGRARAGRSLPAGAWVLAFPLLSTQIRLPARRGARATLRADGARTAAGAATSTGRAKTRAWGWPTGRLRHPGGVPQACVDLGRARVFDGYLLLRLRLRLRLLRLLGGLQLRRHAAVHLGHTSTCQKPWPVPCPPAPRVASPPPPRPRLGRRDVRPVLGGGVRGFAQHSGRRGSSSGAPPPTAAHAGGGTPRHVALLRARLLPCLLRARFRRSSFQGSIDCVFTTPSKNHNASPDARNGRNFENDSSSEN